MVDKGNRGFSAVFSSSSSIHCDSLLLEEEQQEERRIADFPRLGQYLAESGQTRGN
jgi:hypothetical protein